MATVGGADGKRLLDFIADAQAFGGLEPFTTALMDQLADVMHADFATYYVHDIRRNDSITYVPCSREALYGPSAWDANADEGFRGVRDYHLGALGAWSDVRDRPSRLRFETTWYAAKFQIIDCLAAIVPLTRSTYAAVCLHTQDRDVNPRDREAMRLLRPHLAPLIRNAGARRSLAGLVAAVDSDDEDAARGFLLLNHALEVEYATPAARRLLDRWFEGVGARLPSPVEDWVRSTSGDLPLQEEADGKRLVVEAVSKGALVLTEERLPPSALTTRELEVLRCAAAGRTTTQIARDLWVTPATVSKHLEHIYRKLGVTSRTAAIATVGMSLGSHEA